MPAHAVVLRTRLFKAILLLATYCASLVIPARAGIREVEPSAQLLASDGATGDCFGFAVALAGDTLVVGSPYASDVGAAYIFAGSGANWAQIAKLTASDGTTGSQFGNAVAISGNTVAIGAPMQAGGAVYIFVEPATGWVDMTETAKLTYEGNVFGYSVAFGGEGRFLLIGAYFQNAAYVFAKPSTGWVSSSVPTANLVPPPGATAFGSALAASGMTAVVGAETANNSGGAAYVFLIQPGVANINSTAALTASDGGGFLGESLQFAGDTVAAGAQGHNLGAGAVYVFVEPGAGWADMTETAELTVGPLHEGALGAAVAVSTDAIFAGRPSALEGGDVVAYVKPTTGWISNSAPSIAFVPLVPSTTSAFGESVTFDGSTLAGGDFDFNQGQGTVYIFSAVK
jgi:hypothetical protein